MLCWFVAQWLADQNTKQWKIKLCCKFNKGNEERLNNLFRPSAWSSRKIRICDLLNNSHRNAIAPSHENNFKTFLGWTIEPEVGQLHSAKSEIVQKKNFIYFRMGGAPTKMSKNCKRHFDATTRRRYWRPLRRRRQWRRQRLGQQCRC